MEQNAINVTELPITSKNEIAKAKTEKQSIKCVVWDLDETIWQGVLAEDTGVSIRPGVIEAIKELDRRGILQSISSKNNHDDATNKLEELGLWAYFIYPQINWNAKSAGIEKISKYLNFHLNTFAFIDDQPFEREEVKYAHPCVSCFDSIDIDAIVNLDRMKPRFITAESSVRRQLYLHDIQRKKAEESYESASEEFLATLNLCFDISLCKTEDLKRAEELTVRTNQLNTAGYTYSYDELDEFRCSDKHILLVARLDDKYGSYGTIGLCLIETHNDYWTLKLLLMSCRVMSRGVGNVMLHFVMNSAKKAGKTLRAEFISNQRNRLMYITYKFAGFSVLEEKGDLTIFHHDLKQVRAMPEHVAFSFSGPDDFYHQNNASR
jgi:FkbH-like protein